MTRGCGCTAKRPCAYHQQKADTKVLLTVARAITALGSDGIQRILAALSAHDEVLHNACPEAEALFEPRRQAALKLARAASRFAPACERYIRAVVTTQADCARAVQLVEERLGPEPSPKTPEPVKWLGYDAGKSRRNGA